LFHPFGFGFGDVFVGLARSRDGNSLTRQKLYSALTISRLFSTTPQTAGGREGRCDKVSRQYNAVLKFSNFKGLQRRLRPGRAVRGP